MTRLRPLAYGALVAVVAFYYLAVPILRDLFGPAAVLPAYAAVALLAGAATYHAVRVLSAREWAGAEEPASADAEEDAEPGSPDVEDMLQELETEREE